MCKPCGDIIGRRQQRLFGIQTKRLPHIPFIQAAAAVAPLGHSGFDVALTMQQ